MGVECLLFENHWSSRCHQWNLIKRFSDTKHIFKMIIPMIWLSEKFFFWQTSLIFFFFNLKILLNPFHLYIRRKSSVDEKFLLFMKICWKEKVCEDFKMFPTFLTDKKNTFLSYCEFLFYTLSIPEPRWPRAHKYYFVEVDGRSRLLEEK